MVVTQRIEPITRDDILLVTSGLTPEEMSAAHAAFARQNLVEAQAINKLALGAVPPHKTFVDGVGGASEDRVRPTGEIVYEFDLINDLFAWIGDMLLEHSPVLTGQYMDSFILTADGMVVEPGSPLPGGNYSVDEWVFLNTQPYARKIERGLSLQSPDGVFQVVASMASRRFGNVAKIQFSYRAPIFGAIEEWASRTGMESPYRRGAKRDEWLRRQPAIVITRV